MSKKSVAKNYVYNLIYQILTIITPLITTPYLTRILGAHNLGIHGYTVSIVTYFILVGSLGISMYGQREIAYAQDNKEKKSNIFFELNFIKIITYILSIGSYYFIFCMKGDYSLYYKILIVELIANALDITWYFQGMEEFKKTVVRNLIVKVLGLIAIFLFVKTKNDLIIYFILYVLFDLLGNLSLWFYMKNEVVFNFKKLNIKKHIKPIFLLFLPQITVQIYTVLDKTMVGNITNNMSEVGYYDQAQKIVRALLIIVTALGLVMNSRIANSYSKKDEKLIKNYVIQSISMVWLIAMPMILGLIAICHKFIPWYLGEKFLSTIPLINFTAPILLAIGLNNVTGVQYLIQVGKQNLFTLSVFIGAISNAILNYILITHIGTLGAVYSSVIAEFIILFIHLYFLKNVISVFEIFKIGLKNVVASLIMFLIVSIITYNLDISIINSFIEILIGGIVYVLALFVMKDKFFIGLFHQVTDPILKKVR